MKNFKKAFALSLALLMVIAAVVVSPVSAKAEEKADLTILNANFLNNIGEINVFAHPYADQGNWQSSMSGTFCWCPTMLLERQENGNWKVVDLFAEGTEGWGVDNLVLKNSLLGDGKMMVAWHTGSASSNGLADTAAFLDANCAIGTEFVLTGDYADMIAVDEAGAAKDSVALTGTYLTLAPAVEEDTTTDEPAIKDTGDNFVPMFVVLFAGAALVTVASVARKRA